MRTEESQHVVLAALTLALALVCEAYRWLEDDDRQEEPDVVHVTSDVVVLEEMPEGR